MKTLLAISSSILLFSAHFANPAARADRPNIILLLTDDIGWGDPGCYNARGKIFTPNIDRLAREGMRFTNAHTPAGLCAPTRYSMLTGNYPWRGRSPGGTWGFNVPSQMKPGQQTVAKMLQGAGYRTAMFGKAGTGGFYSFTNREQSGKTLAPIEWGFDYSFLIPRGHQSPPLAFFENGVAVGKINGTGQNARAADWDHSQVGERLLEKAVAFLDRGQQAGKPQPFYMHFCSDGAHSPYVPAEKLAGAPLKGMTKMTAHTDMVYETDILLGKLMDALEKRGLLDNTMIVYTSDNGGLPYEREYGHDAVGGLRGRKGFIFEGGNRVPFIVRWPGKVAAGTVRHQPIGTHDLVATALELAGVTVPDNQCLDSVSLVPVLLGKSDDTQPVRRSLLVQSSPNRDADDDGGFSRADIEINAREGVKAAHNADAKPRLAKHKASDHMAHALIEGDWKLVMAMTDQPAALYNLADDRAEQKNLIANPAHADRVKHMEKLYRGVRSSKRSVPASNPKENP